MEHLDVTDARGAVAPDGSNVDLLLRLENLGNLDNLSTARFVFPPHSVSVAVRHRTITEIWHFLSGTGRFWSSTGPDEGIAVYPGMSLSIPPGESFQVSTTSDEPLSAFGVTTPTWPGPDEAEIVDGPWEPTLGRNA